MPNQLNNLLSALQQAKNMVGNVGRTVINGAQNSAGGIKALVNPATRNDYIVGAKQTLQEVLKNPALLPYKPLVSKGGVPPAMANTFKKATEGFTPAAMSRANNVKINYTPYESNAPELPFGPRKLLGQHSINSAGVYSSHQNNGRGAITIGNQYAKDPEVLRHELIHSMDTNVNTVNKSLLPWKNKAGTPYTEEDHRNSAIANEQFADSLPLIIKYLSGLGVLDSRGFYPSADNLAKKYINRQTSGPLYRSDEYPVDPQMLDIEGIAYLGTTGNEYVMPKYQSAIQEAIRAANYPPNSNFGIRSLR